MSSINLIDHINSCPQKENKFQHKNSINLQLYQLE